MDTTQEKRYTLDDALLGGPGLDGYAYRADVYCVDCGRLIAEEVFAKQPEGFTWTDFQDSEQVPQPIFFGESPDCAQHCGECDAYLYGLQESDDDDEPDDSPSGSAAKLPARNDDGKLPAYAWPGGYAIAYLADDGEFLCAADTCANGPDAHVGGDADGWRLDGYQTADWHDCGEDAWVCAHCGATISAAEPCEETEPGEEDVTAADPAGPFFYCGKEVAADRAALRAWMTQGGYYPSVWWISDHGNAHLITDLFDAQPRE